MIISADGSTTEVSKQQAGEAGKQCAFTADGRTGDIQRCGAGRSDDAS